MEDGLKSNGWFFWQIYGLISWLHSCRWRRQMSEKKIMETHTHMHRFFQQQFNNCSTIQRKIQINTFTQHSKNNKVSSLEKKWPHAASEVQKQVREKVAVFWVARRRRRKSLLTPATRACVTRQPAAESRLIQKLRLRSYHHPDDIGACLSPSDINPSVVLPTCLKRSK